MTFEENNILHEPQPDYEKAEMDQLRDALKRSYKERFLMTTTLYKVQLTINKAKITHKPYILSKSL
jgi:hypothetical protein